MSSKRSSDAADDGSDSKRPKMVEDEDFPFHKHIALLQSHGTAICHVPASELQKILKVAISEAGVHGFQGLNIQVHDFQLEQCLVRFLGHWICFRDSERAVDATMDRQTERRAGVLDEEWLAFQIKVLNTFDDPTAFTCDITDSLMDQFLEFLRCGGHEHIDQVYKVCKDTCKTQALTKIFANVFIHDNKKFAQQAPTCDYDRAVQKHVYAWLATVLVNAGDWKELPPRLGRGLKGPKACFHHTHGKDDDCYAWGRTLLQDD